MNNKRFIETYRLSIDATNIPIQFHKLIPLAEIWGIHNIEGFFDIDVLHRILSEATFEEMKSFYTTVAPYIRASDENDLIAWLGSSEAQQKTPTKEYIAMSILVDAYHAVETVLEEN